MGWTDAPELWLLNKGEGVTHSSVYLALLSKALWFPAYRRQLLQPRAARARPPPAPHRRVLLRDHHRRSADGGDVAQLERPDAVARAAEGHGAGQAREGRVGEGLPKPRAAVHLLTRPNQRLEGGAQGVDAVLSVGVPKGRGRELWHEPSVDPVDAEEEAQVAVGGAPDERQRRVGGDPVPPGVEAAVDGGVDDEGDLPSAREQEHHAARRAAQQVEHRQLIALVPGGHREARALAPELPVHNEPQVAGVAAVVDDHADREPPELPEGPDQERRLHVVRRAAADEHGVPRLVGERGVRRGGDHGDVAGDLQERGQDPGQVRRLRAEAREGERVVDEALVVRPGDEARDEDLPQGAQGRPRVVVVPEEGGLEEQVRAHVEALGQDGEPEDEARAVRPGRAVQGAADLQRRPRRGRQRRDAEGLPEGVDRVRLVHAAPAGVDGDGPRVPLEELPGEGPAAAGHGGGLQPIERERGLEGCAQIVALPQSGADAGGQNEGVGPEDALVERGPHRQGVVDGEDPHVEVRQPPVPQLPREGDEDVEEARVRDVHIEDLPGTGTRI